MKHFIQIALITCCTMTMGLFLMGAQPGSCGGGATGGPIEELQGGSEVGNADPEGTSEVGNADPEGTSEVGNPIAYRVIKGQFDTTTDADGNEKCQFEKAVLVDDQLHHTIVEVDDACHWEQKWPVKEPLAIAGVQDQDHQFSLPDQVYHIIGPGPALAEGESPKPIDLEKITVDPVTSDLIHTPIAAEDLIAAEGPDSDYDGIPDEYDDFDDENYYGFYEPGEMNAFSAPWADKTIDYCPEFSDALKVQLKKWYPSKDFEYGYVEDALKSFKGVELIIHYIENGVNKKERTFGTIGMIEAGFIKTSGPKKFKDESYTIECRGWLFQEDSNEEGQLTLDVGCYYQNQSLTEPTASCSYNNFLKIMTSPALLDNYKPDYTKPGGEQVPVVPDQQKLPNKKLDELFQGPATGPKTLDPLSF